MHLTTELPAAAERIIRGRRATRAFLPDPVPDQTIEAIFNLAAAAPSGSNAQPWQVEVVSGTTRDDLADALKAAARDDRRSADFPYHQDMYSPVHLRRQAEFGTALYTALGISREAHDLRAAYDARSLDFYEAPHVALLYAPDSGDPRLTADVGMYAQTLMLAMTAHGVSSCPQALLSFYADTVRETLGVTGGKLLFGIAFGYADPSAPVNAVSVGREPLRKTTRFHR
ncbi:nitroreductase [Crossiella equi]|uniref:Nitroreductase n=1 Tax=Crossiella equi TaxID=130796 RepID=A0ABS5A756_9PSEU|nr:nitroreductase [Crossiella equi]MBP2472391.1 nitroreductase [Crossiella equi]